MTSEPVLQFYAVRADGCPVPSFITSEPGAAAQSHLPLPDLFRAATKHGCARTHGDWHVPRKPEGPKAAVAGWRTFQETLHRVSFLRQVHLTQ